jgi:hypothetical protein
VTRALFHDICLTVITIAVVVASFKGWAAF